MMDEPASRTAARRLTVMFRSQDQVRHHSLATELLARAKRARLAGATLLEASEGEGRSRILRRQHLFAEDAPLSLLIVDDEEKLAAFVDENRDLLDRALVVTDDVTAFRA